MKLTDAFGREIVVGSIMLVPTFARSRGQANRPAVVTAIKYRSGCRYVRLSYTWIGISGHRHNGSVRRITETMSGGRVDDVYVLEWSQVNDLSKKTADALNVISLYCHAKRELNQKMEEISGKATS